MSIWYGIDWNRESILNFGLWQRRISSLATLSQQPKISNICQIKRRSDGNFFLKRANEHFFIRPSVRSNKRVDDMGIKMSQKQFPSASGMCWLSPIVCPMVENGPEWKLAFRYPVSQFSRDCHEILQPLLSGDLTTTLKISRNSIQYFKS